jgi:hypothetical protein
VHGPDIQPPLLGGTGRVVRAGLVGFPVRQLAAQVGGIAGDQDADMPQQETGMSGYAAPIGRPG